MIRVVIGSILLLLWLLFILGTFLAPANNTVARVAQGVIVNSIFFGVPGALLLYFGIRAIRTGPSMRAGDQREMTEFAIGSWRKTRNKEVIGILIEGLEKDKDANVRATAAVVIGEIKDPSGIMPLTKALKDKSEIVRVAACESLGAIADPNSLESLMTVFFKDKSKAVQGVAIQQIERFRSVEAFVQILEHNTDEHKRALAANLLGLSGDQRAKEPLQTAASKDTSNGVRKAATMALEGKSRRFS